MSVIAGIDEAGRGALAGPVVAACVILTKNFPRDILNDSKQLSELQRDTVYEQLLTSEIQIGRAHV